MKLVLPILLALVALPAFASTNDDCKDEAIEAARAALGNTYHVNANIVRGFPVHAEPVESDDYAYRVDVNKGDSFSGTWDVVLDHQCKPLSIKQYDDGLLHQQ